jgi:hypothetical protein
MPSVDGRLGGMELMVKPTLMRFDVGFFIFP